MVSLFFQNPIQIIQGLEITNALFPPPVFVNRVRESRGGEKVVCKKGNVEEVEGKSAGRAVR